MPHNRNVRPPSIPSAIPQESLCHRRFLPSPQPSPCKGEGGEGVSPQPSPCKGEGGEGASPRPSPCKGEGGEGVSPRPSPCKGEGAIIPQELLWRCTSISASRPCKGEGAINAQELL